MLYLLLVFPCSVFAHGMLQRGVCDACFDGVCYSRSQIYNKDPELPPSQLAIDRNNNILYFFSDDSQALGRTVAFDLEDIRFKDVPNIDFSFARAVDQATREVYIGGATGLYKYDPKTNVTTLYGLKDKFIWNMQYKDALYYVMFLEKGLHIYGKKQSRSIKALSDFLIEDFIVDKKGDIYFTSNLKIYKLKKGDKKPFVFLNEIYSLSLDMYDDAYFAEIDTQGLYKIDYTNGRLEEVGAFGLGIPESFVFDWSNNVIYYDAQTNGLYYLSPNYERCKVRAKKLLGKWKIMVVKLNVA